MAEQIPVQDTGVAGQPADRWPTQGTGAGARTGQGGELGKAAVPPMPAAPPSYPPSVGPDPAPGPPPAPADQPAPADEAEAADGPAPASDEAAPAAEAEPDSYPLAPPQAAEAEPDVDGYLLAPPRQQPAYPSYLVFPPSPTVHTPPEPDATPAVPPTPLESQQSSQPPQQGQRRGRGRVFGIVAIAAALVAAAAVAGVLAVGHTSTHSSATTPSGPPAVYVGKPLTLAWSVPAHAGGDARLYGGWVTGRYAIRVDQDGVVAYSLSTGGKAWQAAPPRSGQQPCAMSPTLSAGGVGTVGFGSPGSGACNELVGLDTATGKVLWTVSLKTRNGTGSTAQTYIQGSVATLISPGLVTGVNVSTGRTVWTYHQRGQFCSVYPNGTTGTVLVSDFCAGVTPGYSLSALNPLTGKVEWSKRESGDVDFGSVLSGDPVAATVEAGANAVPYLYDGRGNPTRIVIPSDTGNDPAPFAGSTPAQVVGRQLIVQGNGTVSGENATGGMVHAFDTATGAQAWSYSGVGGHGALLLAPTAGGTLYALSTGAIDGTPQLVRLDPATGRATVMAALPVSSPSWQLEYDLVFATPGGGLVEFGTSTDDDVALFR